MTSLLKEEIIRLAYILGIFALPAWFLRVEVQGLFFGLLVYVILHLRNLHKLHHWLKNNPKDALPDLSGIWEDIAEKIYRLQQNEQAAKQNLLTIIARARSSMSALEEAVVLTDSQGNLEWWNSAAEKLLGFKSVIDHGKPIINLIRDPAFIHYFDHGPYNEGIKLPSWTHANRYVQYEVTRFGHNDRVLIAYDITRLHQLEQIRTDFVANVSHELRTPLTVLSGYIETFADSDKLPSAWQRPFQQMQQQSLRMNNLVNDLLMLSRLESDATKQQAKAINIPLLLEQLRQEANAYSADKKQKIIVQVNSSLQLMGLEADIRSAFSNLITNAIKYTPAQGKIIVSWSHDDKYGYFIVQDTGMGIEPQHIARLTERFYRVDAARSSETGGTGLGLAIVKHVLLQHKAFLNINSKPNVGSTFSCVFARELLVE